MNVEHIHQHWEIETNSISNIAMAYHVYNPMYCKVLIIAICDMQFKSIKVQCVMWTKLNHMMLMFHLANPNFIRFMADNAHANWNVVRIVYGSGDAFMKMVDKE